MLFFLDTKDVLSSAFLFKISLLSLFLILLSSICFLSESIFSIISFFSCSRDSFSSCSFIRSRTFSSKSRIGKFLEPVQSNSAFIELWFFSPLSLNVKLLFNNFFWLVLLDTTILFFLSKFYFSIISVTSFDILSLLNIFIK